MKITINSLMKYIAVLVGFGALSTNQTLADVYKYRGFTVNDAEIQNDPAANNIRIAVNRQIDLCLRVNLSSKAIAAMQKIQVIIVAQDSGSPGAYSRRKKSVSVKRSIQNIGNKPILLHEFMHGLHDSFMPQGFANEDVRKFYEEAKALNVYQGKSHMMSDPGEYFATSATAYLFGVTAQEPFTREKLIENQEKWAQFLRLKLGVETGKYKGELTTGGK